MPTEKDGFRTDSTATRFEVYHKRNPKLKTSGTAESRTFASDK
ncbi:MAG: hypothetical protein V6Z82_05570 [Flavobacteriales bacterium]